MNKYGSMRDGKISACIYMRGDEVDYAACYDVYNAGSPGDKYDLQMSVRFANGRLCAVYDSRTMAHVPTDWTQFVAQVSTRGQIEAIGCVQWVPAESHFRVRLDIDEA